MPHLFIHDTVLSDRRLPLPGRVVVLGRSLDADVPVPHHSVSRRHALIERSDRGYALSDLGSHNGTFLGDRRLAPGERLELPVGGEFRIGQVLILLAADEAIGEKPLSLGPPLAAAPATPAPPAPAPRPAAGKEPERRTPRRRDGRGRGPLTIVLVTAVLTAAAALLLWRIVALHREQRKPPPAPPARTTPADEDVPQPIRLPD